MLPSSKSKTVLIVFNVDKVMDEPEGVPAQWNPKICCMRRAPDPMAIGGKRDKGLVLSLKMKLETQTLWT